MNSKMYGVIDLDGVCANFVEGANLVHGRPGYVATKYDWYSDWGMTDEEFWAPIKRLGTIFYAEYVKPYPWLEQLLNMVTANGTCCINTYAHRNHNDLQGKKIWCDKYIAPHRKMGLVVVDQSELKDWMAAPGRILVDDSPKAIETFEHYGGAGFLFPQPWNGYTGNQHMMKLAAFLDNHREGRMAS